LKESDGGEYRGVALILTIPLKSIYKADQRKRDKFVAQMEKAAEEDNKKPSDCVPLPPDRFVKV
jgi:hypothetical protein